MFRPFGFIVPKTLNYLAFHLMKVIPETRLRTKFDIYVCIAITGSKLLLIDY
jgi:hypothetical protein